MKVTVDSELTSITHIQGQTTIGNLTYTYDANGRPTSTGGSLAKVNLPATVASASVSYNANNQPERSAIAMTIIGGQSLCLLLTLLMTPVAYSLFAELGEKRASHPLRAGLARLRLGLARVFTTHIR